MASRLFLVQIELSFHTDACHLQMDPPNVHKIREDRDTAARQLALLATRTEDLLRENRWARVPPGCWTGLLPGCMPEEYCTALMKIDNLALHITAK